MGQIMKKSYLLSFYLLCISQLTACTSFSSSTPDNALLSNDEEYNYIDATDYSMGNCGVNGISCSETALVNYTKTEADYRVHTERTPRDHLYTKAGVGNNLTATIRPSVENDIVTESSNTKEELNFVTTSVEKTEVKEATKEEYIPVVDEGEFSKTGALNIETSITNTEIVQEKASDSETKTVSKDDPVVLNNDTPKTEDAGEVKTIISTNFVAETEEPSKPVKAADLSEVTENTVAIADNINISKKIITKTITEEDGTIYELICQDADCTKIEQVKQTIQGNEEQFEIICEEDCEEFMLADIDESIITSEFTEESFDLPTDLEEETPDTEVEFEVVGTDEDTQVLAELKVEETKVSDDTVLTWEANEGDNVRELLTKWSALSGWKLLWNTNRNYTLSAGVVFKGKFADVSSALIRAFARARPAPIATYYKGNRVIVVETMENENAY